MRRATRARGAALATAAICAALAVPAGASAHTASIASVKHDVHAAGSALTALKHAGSHSQAAARRALNANKASMIAAGREVRSLAAHKKLTATATGLGLVAKQYDSNVRAYTSLIPVTSGSLQTALAGSLQPALDGRTFADWMLGELTTVLPSGGTTSATGTISDLLGNLPSLIQSLTGVVGSGDVSSEIQGIVAQALTTATGLLDAGLAQVQALLPSLPASDQATVQTVLDQIQSIVGTIQSTLTTAVQTITSSMGGTSLGSTLSSQLQQILGIFQNLLGGLTGTGSAGTGSAGTGSTDTGSTGTCSTGTGSILGSLPIPSFITGLLQNFGLGDLFGGCDTSGSGSTSGSGAGAGAGILGGLFGSLPFGL
jgi:hypothetical protein